MARKKKNQDNLEEEDSEFQVESIDDAVAETPCCESPALCSQESKFDELVEAAKALLESYKQGHTVSSVDDYRYPGMKAIAVALSKLQ